MRKLDFLILFSVLFLPAFATICQTSAPWLDVQVDPCSSETFMGVGIVQDIRLDLRSGFEWGDFDVYLSMDEDAQVNVFELKNNVEMNYPVYEEQIICEDCAEINFNGNYSSCIFRPDYNMTVSEYSNLVDSYTALNFEVPFTFNEYYTSKVSYTNNTNQTCINEMMIVNVTTVNVSNMYVPILMSEVAYFSEGKQFYSLSDFTENVSQVFLKVAIDSPGQRAGAWKFIIVSAGMSLETALSTDSYWFVDPFWWSGDWDFKTSIDVAYPKGLMASYTGFGNTIFRHEVSTSQYIGMRTARVLLDTGSLYDADKIKSDCSDVRFLAEKLPYDVDSWTFPLEAENGINSYASLFMYTNTEYYEDTELWTSPYTMPIVKFGNPSWAQTNRNDWEKYSLNFPDDNDADYFEVTNSDSYSFPSIPFSWMDGSQDRTYIIISAKLQDSSLRDGNYMILDKINWITQTGWGIAIKHTLIGASHEYCPVVLNGAGGITAYEGACRTTSSTTFESNFVVAYDSDYSRLWIVDADDLSMYMSATTNSDPNINEHYFESVTLSNSNDNLLISSDSPTRDFVGTINYLEFVSPNDVKARWGYVLSRLQLLENSFIEVPYVIEGGKDTGNWSYDGQCHTSLGVSQTAFLVTVPTMVRLPVSSLDHRQERLSSVSLLTECSLFTSCEYIADGSFSTYWTATAGQFGVWTMIEDFGSQGYVIVIDDTSSTGSGVNVSFFDGSVMVRSEVHSVSQAGQIIFEDLRESPIMSFNKVMIKATGSVKIQEFELFTSNVLLGTNLIAPYRKTITFFANKDDTNYPLEFNIDTASLISQGKLDENCSNLAFTDTAGNLLDKKLIEKSADIGLSCNTTSTTFWVEIPNVVLGENLIYMLYNLNQSFSSKDYSVFAEFYDDFDLPDGGFSSPDWFDESYYEYYPDIHISSGNLFIYNSGVHSIQLFSPGVKLIMNASLAPDNDRSCSVGFNDEYYGGSNFSYFNQIDWNCGYESNIPFLWSRTTGGYLTELSALSTFNILTVAMDNSSSSRFYINNNSVANHSNAPSYMPIRFISMPCGRWGTGGGWTVVDWVGVFKSGSIDSVSVGTEQSGSFEINQFSEPTTVKALVVPQSAISSTAEILSVGNLFKNDLGVSPVYFSDKIRVNYLDISGGQNIFRIVLQKPYRMGGIYFIEDSIYGNKRVQFVYEDDSFFTANQHGVTTYSSAYGAGSTAFYNKYPDTKVKEIYVYLEVAEDATANEIWSRIRFLSAPVGDYYLLNYFPEIGVYYGNPEATAPDYNPHTNTLIRAFSPNLLFEFSDDEKGSQIYDTFQGGLTSAVSGGSLLTDLLSADLRININKWNNKTYDATHEWVAEYWRNIATSGVSIFANINSLASSDYWDLGDHYCTFGYPIKDGTTTFFSDTITNPYSLLSAGGRIFIGAEEGCYKCYGNYRLVAENISGTSRQISYDSNTLPFCSSLFNLDNLKLAIDDGDRESIDSLKWIFTEPFHEWTISTVGETFYADISLDSVTVLPAQVKSGVPFVVRAMVTSEELPLSGATCSALYAGDTHDMTETEPGKYSAEISAVYEIETIYVSCSYGASSDSGSAIFDVVLSEYDFISINAHTDLASNIIANGEDFAPLAWVSTNSYDNLVCLWYYEGSPSSTHLMIDYTGLGFNYAPVPGNIFSYTDDVIVECCRGDFCNNGKMTVKIIDEVSVKDIETVYFNNELPLGGDFAVKTDIRALGNIISEGGLTSFSQVIVPEDAYQQESGATIFPNTNNSFGAIIQFEGLNYSATWNGNEFQSANITAPMSQGAYNYVVYVYYVKENSLKIIGTGLGVVYAGSEVPVLDVSILPISPNYDIIATTIDIETKDKDTSTPVEMICDVLITALLNDTTVSYNTTRAGVGDYSLFLSDMFLGDAKIRTECIPDTLNYTGAVNEQDYTFGSSSMTVDLSVNPNFALSGSTVTATATASYGSFESCVPGCYLFVEGVPYGHMNCTNVDGIHSLSFTAPTNPGAYNVEAECTYGSDTQSDIDAFMVGTGGYVSIYFDPSSNTNAEYFTIYGRIGDVDGTPLTNLICSATVLEEMSGVSQSYTLAESEDGLYSVYVDDGWLGDVEVRISCVDPENAIQVTPKEVIYNIGGLAPYNIGIFTAPQLPSQCSDNLQMQLFLAYRENANGTYTYPSCPDMLCDVVFYDEAGFEITTVSSIPSIGDIRTAFIDMSNVCGSVTMIVECTDPTEICTGGSRRAYINLGEGKPKNDYCGNGICGRGEFGECDWDCSVFQEFSPFVSASMYSNEYRVSLFNETLYCRMDRDWVDVTRQLPFAYTCGTNEYGFLGTLFGNDEACTSRAISNSIILMKDASDYEDLPETLQADFNLPEYYSVSFGTTTLTLPAESVLRNPVFASEVQGIYGTFKYPLLISLQSGDDKIVIDRFEPTDIYGYIDLFYKSALACEPSDASTCFSSDVSLNKSTVLLNQYQTLTCWNDEGHFFVENYEDSFEYDPSSGMRQKLGIFNNLTLIAGIIIGMPLLYAFWNMMIKMKRLEIDKHRTDGGGK